MLRTAFSGEPAFICIDALRVDKLVDECVEEHRAKLLNSLNQILRHSPGTRILAPTDGTFKMKAGSNFSGRVTTIRIAPRRGDIIKYIYTSG